MHESERPSRAAARWQNVEDLVFLWLMADDRGEATLRKILAPCPELEPDVRRAIQKVMPLLARAPSEAGATHASAPVANAAGAGLVPDRLGPFRLEERIGAGAMGAVYRARDEQLGRDVAVKLVHPEHLWLPGRRERFRLEVMAVARLSHAAIVPVYTAGEERGIPYYAMELVAGSSLAQVIARLASRPPQTLSARDLAAAVPGAERDGPARGGSANAPALDAWSAECVRLCAEAADALAHAHARGVLHRDIKPSNILVGRDLRARVVDFGLARATPDQSLTRSGTPVGSLAYMAPEQVVGAEVDERADVYALGATLYELLTLRSPFLAPHAEETRRRILAGDLTAPRELNPRISRDVAAVLAVALDRDPARRYSSMVALHSDLRALLEGCPIAAKPPGPLRHAERWARRHKVAASLVAVGVLLLVTAPTAYAVGATLHRDAAIAARDEANRLRAVDRARAYRADLGAAETALRASNTIQARARLSDCPEAERGFEWRLLEARLDLSLAVLRKHESWVRGVAVTADGARAFSGDFGGAVYEWNLVTHEARPLTASGPPCLALAASADGRVVATGHLDGSVRVWDPEHATERGSFQLEGWAVAVDVSRDGRRVIAGGKGGDVVVLDVDTASRRSFAWGKTLSLALSPDGERAAAALPVDVAIFDLASGERVLTCAGHGQAVPALAFDQDGTRLLTGSLDETARVWDARTGALQRVVAAQSGVMDATFVGSDRIATAGNDSTLRLWDAATGAQVAVYQGHEAGLYAVAADARAQVLVSGGADDTVRTWRASGSSAHAVFHCGHAVHRIGWLDDDLLLATLDTATGIALCDARDGAARAVPPALAEGATSMATRAHAIAAGTAGAILLWTVPARGGHASDDADRDVARCATGEHHSNALAFVDAQRLVSGGDAGEVIVVDALRREVVARTTAHDGPVISLAVAAHGAIASGGGDGTIVLHDPSLAGAPRREPATGKQVLDLCFSPDARYLLSAEDDAVCLRDATTLALISARSGHQGKVRGVAWLAASPVRLVSVGMDRTLRFWSLDASDCLVAIEAHTGPAYAIACTTDGAAIATGSVDGWIGVWR